MKSKDFNSPKPYVYMIKIIKADWTDKKYYFGLRWENVSLKRSVVNDFGISYFTSQKKLKKDIKLNKKNYELILKWTFDDIDEAINYEHKINQRLIHRPNWLNKAAYPQIKHDLKDRQEISKRLTGRKLTTETKERISKSKKLFYKNAKYFVHPMLGKKRTQEERKNISEGLIKTDKHPTRGKKPSKETREKISKSNTGKKMSLQTIEKMKNKVVSKETREKLRFASLGTKRTAETKAKMSKSHMGYKHTPEARKNMSGRPMPKHVKKALKESRLGTTHTNETKDKIRFTKSSLTKKEILQILALRKKGFFTKDIAKIYNQTAKNISKICLKNNVKIKRSDVYKLNK